MPHVGTGIISSMPSRRPPVYSFPTIYNLTTQRLPERSEVSVIVVILVVDRGASFGRRRERRVLLRGAFDQRGTSLVEVDHCGLSGWR
jgi:hypothetical protein